MNGSDQTKARGAGVGEGRERGEADQRMRQEGAGGDRPRHAARRAVLRRPACAATGQRTQHRPGLADHGDRIEQQRERRLGQNPGQQPRRAAITLALRRSDQHLCVAKPLRRIESDQPGERQRHGPPRRKRRDGVGCRAPGSAGEEDEGEGWAGEQQYRLNQLPAAHRTQARPADQLPVLQIAGEPARVAAQELGQCRRGGLARAVLGHHHTDAPAGGAQQRRLHLVVRQDGVAVREQGQARVRAEGRDADQRVVAPIGSLVALPPVLAGRPGPHPGAHAELVQPRKRRRGRQADGEVLRDAEPRVGLHHADEAKHRIRLHRGVGVEHQHEVEAGGVAVEEVHDVAGLEAAIARPPAIGDARIAGAGGALGRLPRRIAVGEHEGGEGIAPAGRRQAVEQMPQRHEDRRHRFVAHGHHDRRCAAACRGKVPAAAASHAAGAGSRSCRWRRTGRPRATAPPARPASGAWPASSRRGRSRGPAARPARRRRRWRWRRSANGGTAFPRSMAAHGQGG